MLVNVWSAHEKPSNFLFSKLFFFWLPFEKETTANISVTNIFVIAPRREIKYYLIAFIKFSRERKQEKMLKQSGKILISLEERGVSASHLFGNVFWFFIFTLGTQRIVNPTKEISLNGKKEKNKKGYFEGPVLCCALCCQFRITVYLLLLIHFLLRSLFPSHMKFN